MMRRTLPALLLLVAMHAQAQPSSMGTEFWVTYMENLDLQFNTPPYFELVISSDVDTQGEVQIPATGYAIPFSVMALHDTVITLPTNVYYPEGDETIFDFGMRVVADDPVSVYAYHHRLYFSEAAMAFPLERLGTEYMVLAHEDNLYSHPSEFVVLATQDATTIAITPSVVTAGFRPPGVTFTEVLDAGQVFQLKAYGDISGTVVRSTDAAKPIAVFAGAQQAVVNCNLGADDHLYQQVEPISGWGMVYRVVPFKFRGGDQVRVLGSVDNTTVVFTGLAPMTVDSGQVLSVQVVVPLTITASAPIAVGQFNESQGCNPSNGDPAYLWLEPADRMDERAIWSSLTGAGTPNHYANVVAQGKAGSPVVILDGIDVSAQLAPMVGVPGVYWAQYDVAAGEHVLDCPNGCQGSGYGFGEYNSYAYQLGYGSSPLLSGIGGVGTDDAYDAVIVLQDGTFTAATLGFGAQQAVEVFDLSGRVVLRAAAHSAVLHTLNAGHYVARGSDVDGRPAMKRVLIEER